MEDDLVDLDEIELQKDRKSKIFYIKKTAQKLATDSKSDIPIQINTIVKHLTATESYKIFPKSMELKEKFSGQIIKSGNAVGIIYNSTHSVVRQRFTFAHELGHLVLNHDLRVQTYNELINLKTKTPIEREANMFAAELLMPKKIVRDYLKKNQVKSVKELANIFNVSEEAMWYKITEENLINYI